MLGMAFAAKWNIYLHNPREHCKMAYSLRLCGAKLCRLAEVILFVSTSSRGHPTLERIRECIVAPWL
jgi:hypothetical protein